MSGGRIVSNSSLTKAANASTFSGHAVGARLEPEMLQQLNTLVDSEPTKRQDSGRVTSILSSPGLRVDRSEESKRQARFAGDYPAIIRDERVRPVTTRTIPVIQEVDMVAEAPGALPSEEPLFSESDIREIVVAAERKRVRKPEGVLLKDCIRAFQALVEQTDSSGVSAPGVTIGLTLGVIQDELSYSAVHISQHLSHMNVYIVHLHGNASYYEVLKRNLRITQAMVNKSTRSIRRLKSSQKPKNKTTKTVQLAEKHPNRVEQPIQAQQELEVKPIQHETVPVTIPLVEIIEKLERELSSERITSRRLIDVVANLEVEVEILKSEKVAYGTERDALLSERDTLKQKLQTFQSQVTIDPRAAQILERYGK